MSTTVYLDNKILHLPNVGMDDHAMCAGSALAGFRCLRIARHA